MLLHMLLFGAYAIYYALILGSNMLSRGDCATLLYCCMVVSGLFTLVFGGDIVFFIYLTSVRMLLYTEKCFETTLI